MDRVTATPAISLPRPNIMHPAYAVSNEDEGAIPDVIAKVTIAAPAAISPTKMEPVILTPHLSRSIPQTIRPPHTQRNE